MKPSGYLAFFLMVLTVCSCRNSTVVSSKQKEEGPYTVSVISKGIYHIQDYNSSNPAGELFDADGKRTHFNNCSDIYLLVGRDKALLIDLSNHITWADNPEKALREIVSSYVGERELTITFTHNHGDHTGMLPAYIDDKDVTFALPRIDFANLLDRFPEDRVYMIEEGYVFDLGGVEVETVLVPGHSEGSMVFFVKGRNIAFTGDAVGLGHGIWVFSTELFAMYEKAVPHLMQYINNPENHINRNTLKLFGGHYWQKDWCGMKEGEAFGIEYLDSMVELLAQMEAGIAMTEPSNLGRPELDTYFVNGDAIVVWSAEQAEAYCRR